jgi:hypothetical protein
VGSPAFETRRADGNGDRADGLNALERRSSREGQLGVAAKSESVGHRLELSTGVDKGRKVAGRPPNLRVALIGGAVGIDHVVGQMDALSLASERLGIGARKLGLCSAVDGTEPR